MTHAFVSPSIGRSTTNVELRDWGNSDYQPAGKDVVSVLSISHDDAKVITGALRQMSGVCPARGKNAKLWKSGKLAWQIHVEPNHPHSEHFARAVKDLGLDLADILATCVKAQIKVYREVDDKLTKTGKSDRTHVHVSTIYAAVYASYVVEDRPGFLKGKPRLVWNYSVTGETEFTETTASYKKQGDYYQILINRINSPYRAIQRIMKNTGVRMRYSEAIKAAIRSGDNHVSYISFDYYTQDQPREQLINWLEDLYARMNNLHLYRKGKKKQRQHRISAAHVKRLAVKANFTNDLTIRSVTFTKSRSKADGNSALTKCSFNAAIVHRGIVGKPCLRVRHMLSRHVLLEKQAELFGHLKGLPNAKINEDPYHLTVKDLVHMSVTNHGGMETSKNPFYEAARKITYGIEFKEFAIHQLMGLKPDTLKNADRLFTIGRTGKATEKRKLFWEYFLAGKFHHPRGKEKWQPLTQTELANLTGLNRRFIGEYKAELLAMGIDVDLPIDLIVKITEHSIAKDVHIDDSIRKLNGEEVEEGSKAGRKKAVGETGEQAFKRISDLTTILGFSPAKN